MKILNAGTEVLDDKDVLKYIKDKRKQHIEHDKKMKTDGRIKTSRPQNFLQSLNKHEQHLEHAERPFINNPQYDENEEYLSKLMKKLEPRSKLTKTEWIMVINHRPHNRELLLPMIEDIDTRYNEEDQAFMIDSIVEVLGGPRPKEAADGEGMITDG